jgi:hypothetical protein
MRTKPRSRTWRRKRRKNSCADRVIFLFLFPVCIILRAKRDLVTLEGHKTVVGDGDAMRVNKFVCAREPDSPRSQQGEFFYRTSFGIEWKPIFDHLWSQAEEALKQAERVVICGYSLLPVDIRACDMILHTPSRHAKVKLSVAVMESELRTVLEKLDTRTFPSTQQAASRRGAQGSLVHRWSVGPGFIEPFTKESFPNRRS